MPSFVLLNQITTVTRNLTLVILLNQKCEYKCRTSASVKSEIRASNDLIHEMICQLNLRAMIAIEMKQIVVPQHQ